MGTRCHIGYVSSYRPYGGSVKCPVVVAYCHYDGNLDHTGRLLTHHYPSREKAHHLVNNGYMSGLYPTVEQVNARRVHSESADKWGSIEEYFENIPSEIEYVYLWGRKYAANERWHVWMPPYKLENAWALLPTTQFAEYLESAVG